MPSPPTRDRQSHLGGGERREGEKSEILLLVGITVRLRYVCSCQQHDMTQHVILSATLSVQLLFCLQ